MLRKAALLCRFLSQVPLCLWSEHRQVWLERMKPARGRARSTHADHSLFIRLGLAFLTVCLSMRTMILTKIMAKMITKTTEFGRLT